MISGPMRQKRTVIVDFEHVFKAKKVMVWDVSRRFAESALFIAKANFFVESLFSGGIPHFSGKKCIPPVPGLQNSSQNLTFIKDFAPGARKSPFGAKRRTSGPRILKKAEFYVFC